MNKRYKTVLGWFEEYGFQIVKKGDGISCWHETIMKDLKDKTRIFQITNNNIWYMKNGRTSFGKTKTELYYNLDKHFS